MFFSSVKEINRLMSKGMSNIYLKASINKKLRFSLFKKFVSRSVFGELQLTKISLNFKSSCCNLKIRGLRAKALMAFLILTLNMNELWRLKSQRINALIKT